MTMRRTAEGVGGGEEEGGVGEEGGGGEEGEGGSSEVDNRGKGWELDVHRVTPRLESDIPTRWAGPDIGQHNKEVLGGLLKLSDTRMKELKDKGVIGA